MSRGVAAGEDHHCQVGDDHHCKVGDDHHCQVEDDCQVGCRQFQH